MNPAQEPQLVETGRGSSVVYHDRHLYSARDPERAPRRIAVETAIRSKTLILLPSPLLGHGIPELLARLPENCFLAGIEADPALSAFTRTRLPESVVGDRRFAYFGAEGLGGLGAWLASHAPYRFRRVLSLPMNGAYALHASTYDDLCRLLESQLRVFWQNRMTTIHMAPLWFRNVFRNLRHTVTGSSLGALDPGKPIVLAGAGLSLEQCVAWMKKLRAEYFLAAVDTALPFLTSLGVRPDLVFLLDSQWANSLDFYGCPDDFDVVCDLGIHPPLLRRLRGNKRFFASRIIETELIGRMEAAGLLPQTQPALGSVGVAALWYLTRATACPVILAGIDFSYARGKFHASGSPSHLLELVRRFRLAPDSLITAFLKRPTTPEKSVSGDAVWSDLMMKTYSDQLVSLFDDERDRIFQAGAQALASPFARIPDGKSAADFLRSWKGAEAAESTLTDADAFCADAVSPMETPAALKVERFLSGELERLERLHSVASRWLQGEKEAGDELLSRLREADYLYCAFPDLDDGARLEPNFVKRVLLAAGAYARIIGESLHSDA